MNDVQRGPRIAAKDHLKTGFVLFAIFAFIFQVNSFTL